MWILKCTQYPGNYFILKVLPQDLTVSQLKLRSYPDKTELTSTNLRLEWKGWYYSRKYGI